MKFEADVNVSRNDDGSWSVLIDGEEMSGVIAQGGLRLEISDDEFQSPLLWVRLLPKQVTLNLPAAVVTTSE